MPFDLALDHTHTHKHFILFINHKSLYLLLKNGTIRLNTGECMHLVRFGHFRSCDKDSGHTIQFTMAENPMLHANFMVLCFIELGLMPIEVLHRGIKIFYHFCSCNLDLDQMTFIYETDPYSQMYKYELPT